MSFPKKHRAFQPSLHELPACDPGAFRRRRRHRPTMTCPLDTAHRYRLSRSRAAGGEDHAGRLPLHCGVCIHVLYSASEAGDLCARHVVHGHGHRFRGTTFPGRDSPSNIAPCLVARPRPRGRGAALPARALAAHAAALPPSADVLGLCGRGATRVRRAAGRLACRPAYRTLPSVRHQRVRSGPGTRKCAAAAGLMSAACRIRALQLDAANGRIRRLRSDRISSAAAGKQR